MRPPLPLLLALLACNPPSGETAGPHLIEPWVRDTTWEQHETFGSILRVRWWQEVHAVSWVAYRFDDETWLASPAALREEGEQEQLLVGIPYDTELELRVVVDAGEVHEQGEILEASTGALPMDLPRPELLVADPEAWDPSGNWLLTSINTSREGWSFGDYVAFILDRQARVVWAWALDHQHICFQAQPSLDGRSLLLDENTFWSFVVNDAESRVHRMRLDGTVLETVEIPEANHPYSELGDGRLAWWAVVSNEGLLRIREGEDPWETRWTCRDWYASQGIEGSCLSNTVFPVEDGSFLVSLPMQDLVVQVDPDGSVRRSFGQQGDAWGFAEEGTAFWLQHGVSFTDQGTLLMSSHQGEDDLTGVVREYALDEDARQLRLIWSYGEGLGVEAELGGGALRLPGGNTLHFYGTTPRIKEITPEGGLAWDIAWPEPRLIGHASLIEDLYPLLGE
jgi:hypothetical protein